VVRQITRPRIPAVFRCRISTSIRSVDFSRGNELGDYGTHTVIAHTRFPRNAERALGVGEIGSRGVKPFRPAIPLMWDDAAMRDL
jgi:hypothetical protein